VEVMKYAKVKEITLRLHEEDNPTFQPSIARTAMKGAYLVARLIDSDNPKLELDKWLKEQNKL
jgi:hypothetical protein